MGYKHVLKNSFGWYLASVCLYMLLPNLIAQFRHLPCAARAATTSGFDFLHTILTRRLASPSPWPRSSQYVIDESSLRTSLGGL